MAKISTAEVRKLLRHLQLVSGWDRSGLRGLLTPVKGRGKGGNFERDMARAFSRWWTGGDRDDIFWRTGGSGGRATARSKASKSTAGQYGDLAATDPLGHDFISWATVELKRGYADNHIGNLLDGGAHNPSKPKGLEGFFAQAIESARQADSYTWMLVHARDRREPIVWMPANNKGSRLTIELSSAEKGIRFRDGVVDVVGLRLSDFFNLVTPDEIKEITCQK